jgi:hypothetical protein
MPKADHRLDLTAADAAPYGGSVQAQQLGDLADGVVLLDCVCLPAHQRNSAFPLNASNRPNRCPRPFRRRLPIAFPAFQHSRKEKNAAATTTATDQASKADNQTKL